MKILLVYGTRPEILKLIPVIIELRNKPGVNLKMVNTGQHREMVKDIEEVFDIVPDYSLDIMQSRQSLISIFVNVLKSIEPVLEVEQPEVTILQGDTSTVAAVATACFYKKMPVAHVEAGLRSYDLEQPFPEEFNRRLVSISARYNFAPTAGAAENLLKEGVPAGSIHITGNTIVDMVNIAKKTIHARPSMKKKILITAHRRENHSGGINEICQAVKRILSCRKDVGFVWPVHPSPIVREVVERELKGLDGVELVKPLGYLELLQEIQDAHLIWTDSGGIQEECPAFKKPVLILRNVTERPEVVESGFGELVATDPDLIVSRTQLLLDDKLEYERRISGINPFGDGNAGKRIANILMAEVQ